MTICTNDRAVPKFYWILKAIKKAIVATPKCRGPPQGDIDNPIHAIADQMGLNIVKWKWDSEDWDMPAPEGRNLPVVHINATFSGYVQDQELDN
jgi:hypothetical protein